MERTAKASRLMNRLSFFVMAVLLICVYGCGGSEREKELRAKQETIEAQAAQIKLLKKQLAQLQPQGVVNTDDGSAGVGGMVVQYYFIVLSITENHHTSLQRFNWTTAIRTIGVLNDDLKYRLLDQEVVNYQNSPNGIVYNGSIKKREIFLYNSYQEASRAREKYIMN